VAAASERLRDGEFQKKGRPPKRHVAVDSSGLEERRRSDYYVFRIQKAVRRREFRKLHLASESRLPEKPIYSWELTDALRGDSPLLIPLLERIDGPLGDVSADKAYPSRKNAQYVADRGGTPFLMPKANSTTKAKGHPAWKRMVRFRRERPKAFGKRYHKRSNGEATNGAFKGRFGGHLRSRKWWNQKREVAQKVVAYNLRLLIRHRIRWGLEAG
jgi:hypothetical protein